MEIALYVLVYFEKVYRRLALCADPRWRSPVPNAAVCH